MNEQKGAALETIQESCRFVLDQFSWISVHEIELAFKLSASNTFENVEMKAYGGIFTIAMLGDILTAYKIYRNKIIQKFEIENDKIIQEENQKEIDRKNAEARLIIKNNIDKAIELRKNNEYLWECWQDVPAHYAKIALEHGFIEIEHDFKKLVYEKAQQLAKKQLIEKSQDLRNIYEAKNAKRILMEFIEKPLNNEHSHTIYAKLLIFEYIHNKSF